MIPWIQVYSNLPRHPKVSRLADELGLTSKGVNPNVVATGMLVSLWTWAIQNAYDGDLSGCGARAIADACTWTKDPQKLVDALVKDGVVVIDPAGEPFDALEAQAVGTVPDEEAFDETVRDVYQKGYKMGKKVLRPAMVTITTGGPTRPKEDEAEAAEGAE